MTKQASLSFEAFLFVICVFGPSFFGGYSNAFSILPVTLKQSHVTCRGAIISSPFKLSTNNMISPRKSVYGIRDIQDFRPCTSATGLSMYNLPPGGGGGKNKIEDIAKGAFSILATIAFFVSPLGGIVLGLFNSVLVLLFLLPLVATFGFQVWEKVNTVQAPCPVCGVQTSVMKSKNDANVVGDVSTRPTLCFTCGAMLQANEDNTGINNVSGRTTIDDLDGTMGQRSSLFDVLTTNEWSTATSKTENSNSNKKEKSDGIEKDAIIDVDVLDEEKPFQ